MSKIYDSICVFDIMNMLANDSEAYFYPKSKDFKYIRITLKGDNKNYQFRLKSSKSDYYSYIKEFKTSDIWETIDIKIADLYPSFRGRKLDMPNFGEPSFEEIAFLIANKKDDERR